MRNSYVEEKVNVSCIVAFKYLKGELVQGRLGLGCVVLQIRAKEKNGCRIRLILVLFEKVLYSR